MVTLGRCDEAQTPTLLEGTRVFGTAASAISILTCQLLMMQHWAACNTQPHVATTDGCKAILDACCADNPHRCVCAQLHVDVRMYRCMYVHISACTYVHMCKCTRVFAHVCMRVFAHVCMCACRCLPTREAALISSTYFTFTSLASCLAKLLCEQHTLPLQDLLIHTTAMTGWLLSPACAAGSMYACHGIKCELMPLISRNLPCRDSQGSLHSFGQCIMTVSDHHLVAA